jgi:phosphoribosylanthranilate isomerase
MTLVKICGINSEVAFDVSVEAGADYLGFVFFNRSPRLVSARQAASLSARHPAGPQRVGLFVDPSADDIQLVLNEMKLDALQIYGDAAACRNIKARFGLTVWSAVGVAAPEDLPASAHGVDGFVIEPKAPASASRPGGNAMTMDWTILEGWRSPLPWLLAGGLNAENIAGAIIKTGAPGVDVSSGVESLPGVKSPALIRRFVANVRNAERLVG